MKKHKGPDIFRNRKVVIATMHRKEKVIAPLLEEVFDMETIIPKNFNTDQFGTFSGEIKRVKSPLETVRSKALAALLTADEDLVLASEGSFGPHPESPFITGNEELVLLIDTKNDFEIIGRHFTENTNFNHQKIESVTELQSFADSVGFPKHGIILKISTQNKLEEIFKDFENFDVLQKQVSELLENSKSIYAETDMRASMNPTRMNAIKEASQNLISKMNSVCPKCNAPGFSIVEALFGLRCKLCNSPTKGIRAYILNCQKCDFICERKRKDISFQDPTFCDYCNP